MNADSWMLLVCLVSIACAAELAALVAAQQPLVWSHRGAGLPQHTGSPARIAPVPHRDVGTLADRVGFCCGPAFAGKRPGCSPPGRSANFGRGRRVRPRTQPHPALCAASGWSPRRVARQPRPNICRAGLPPWSCPYAILAAAAIFLQANWQRLPSRFPIHWGIGGTPDRWAERNWRGVDGPLLAGLHGHRVAARAGLYDRGRISPRTLAETADWTARFRRANLR
jgi:hypothetical protein